MDRTEEIVAGEAWAEEFVAEELAEVGGRCGGRSCRHVVTEGDGGRAGQVRA
jgi:hypothetical protein